MKKHILPFILWYFIIYYKGWIYVYPRNAWFRGQLIEKNKRITLRVWVPGRVEEMPKKGQKCNLFWDRYQFVTIFLHPFFKGFSKIGFQILSFSHKKCFLSCILLWDASLIHKFIVKVLHPDHFNLSLLYQQCASLF